MKTHQKIRSIKGFFSVEREKRPSYMQFRRLYAVTPLSIVLILFIQLCSITLNFRKGKRPFMKVKYENNSVILSDVDDFSLEQTLNCGQCFRWEKDENEIWHGIVCGKKATLYKREETVCFEGVSRRDFETIWWDYFDLGRDYSALKDSFSENPILEKACSFASGIRVLHQEPWEAFITFIISQNNNITRIKRLVKRLCEAFGEEISEGEYSFPSPEKLSLAKEEELRALGCGYRSSYIIKAADEVNSGRLILDDLNHMVLSEARNRLMQISGIGPKVADCILLYGFGRTECCPMDVWMKRVLLAFGGSLPECVEDNAGIAQQFLFHYARNNPEKFVNVKT